MGDSGGSLIANDKNNQISSIPEHSYDAYERVERLKKRLDLEVANPKEKTRRTSKATAKRAGVSNATRQASFLTALADHEDVLAERKAHANQNEFEEWYYKPPTELQLAKIKTLSGGAANTKGLNRGELSDLIGLCKKAEAEDTRKLKFLSSTPYSEPN